ncbi:hypothetical protein AF169_14600 [Listeria monocytogenes]|nr:hypothetical protein [Listeria monocytogenes]EAD9681045.1 hypothetical protein [Listeria monocytogenes]ECV1051025.1 hypothetical protein [Listeria monocytogenes]
MTTSKRMLTIFILTILLLSIISFCFLYVQANSKVVTQREIIKKMNINLRNRNEENITLKGGTANISEILYVKQNSTQKKPNTCTLRDLAYVID